MKQKVILRETETAATNSDFYNLFRPIAPSIDRIGKVAQVISALTEAITIWHLAQSEMAGASKVVAITVSILATLLVVAILELGGRKFLQVLTRAVIWKRLKNVWYITLFAIVTFITIGIGVMSFRLSTNGIHHAFVSNVPVVSTFDHSDLKEDYRASVKVISDEFDTELSLLKGNHEDLVKSKMDKFQSRIEEAEAKVQSYERKYKSGEKWAKSQANKYRKKAKALSIQKADALIALQEKHMKKTDNWLARKNRAIDLEKEAVNQEIVSGKKASEITHQSKSKDADFWGTLFSFLVGFSVILAFICIITVEIFRRGSGIEVAYEEEDLEPSIIEMFWMGITNRFQNFFRQKAERFAQVSPTSTNSNRQIGFDYPKPIATGYAGDGMEEDGDF